VGSTEGRRILIAQEGELRSGLLVDQMVDIAGIASAAINPPPAPLEGGKGVYIAGQAEYAEETLVILDLSEIFRRALETEAV
jgi:chemotaxis signal transduction protein